MPEPGNPTAFAPVIFAYTRAQAIDDGILVDVSETAREAGFKIPVAVTRTVWNRLIALPERDQSAFCKPLARDVKLSPPNTASACSQPE